MSANYVGYSPLNLVITSKEDRSANELKRHVVDRENKFLTSIFNKNRFNIPRKANSPNATTDSTFTALNRNEENTTDIQSIIGDKLPPSMRLNISDFAYLKDVGVYPTNRLMVARRFTHGVQDDIRSITNGTEPLCTLVSWVKEDENFLNITYGEEWVDAEHSFEQILNSMGNDVTPGDSDNKKNTWGGFLGKFANALPLPGMAEGLQYSVFKSLGWTDVDHALIPYGNPNLIREAKRRKVLERGGGSTLTTNISINFETTYEIKYFPGIDPRLIYLDIIANAISFGTSNSDFQFNGQGSKVFKGFVEDISSGTPSRIKRALINFVRGFVNSILGLLNDIRSSFNEFFGDMKLALTQQDGFSVMANKYSAALQNLSSKLIQTWINKYKVKIMGVINAITGTPSGYWHIMIGNPKKPIFSSGDMLAKNVSIELGPVLNFNDLPSSVKIKFTLENARSLGAQEIFRKMNCGKERSYQVLSRTFIENHFFPTKEEYEQAREYTNDSAYAGDNVTNNQVPESTTLASKYQPVIDYLTENSIVDYPGVVTVQLTTNSMGQNILAVQALNLRDTPNIELIAHNTALRCNNGADYNNELKMVLRSAKSSKNENMDNNLLNMDNYFNTQPNTRDNMKLNIYNRELLNKKIN